MIKYHFLISFRNLWRNRGFSLINIAGLAIGLTVFLFIAEYVASEWSSNRFHQNYDSLYRIVSRTKDGNVSYFIPPGYARVLKKQVNGIHEITRVADGVGGGVVSIPQSGANLRSLSEDKICYADGSFFRVFTFPMLAGNGSVDEPNTMALSASAAVKYFGNTQVVGKTIQVTNQFGAVIYTITGVFQDMPPQSDIQTSLVLSYKTLENPANLNDNSWADPNGLESGYVNSYILADSKADMAAISKQSDKLLHLAKPDSKGESLLFQPFKELHLAPSFTYPLPTFGNLTFVTAMLAVGLLIILIAWINYVNLSTVQVLTRAKETGVRKILGANRKQLTLQYLTETVLLTLFSTLLAGMLVLIFQPFYNQFTGGEFSLLVLNQKLFLWGIPALLLLGPLFAGGYVSFMLSGQKPGGMLRAATSSVQGLAVRKGLVIFQFAASIVFIICTLVIHKQLRYMQKEKLGIDIKQLLVIKGPSGFNANERQASITFKNKLAQLPFIKKYASSNNIPGQGYNFSATGITRLAALKDDSKKAYSMLIVDDRFFDTYGISFLSGRAFNPEEAQKGWSSAKKVILNEKAALQLGFKKGELVSGKKILWGDEYEVTGVIEDYHHLSLREAILPTVYLPSVAQGYFTIATDGENMKAKLAALKGVYQEIFPNTPFEYSFVDEVYGRQYQSELRLGSIFISCVVVAVLIACLGLFGLASFSSRQRRKEIGIRKVLGASVTGIIALLSKEYLKLVLIALLIASPIAWYFTHQWLQGFAYQVEISWWVFLVAGFMAGLVALSTIAFQALKAALTNPVKSLRTE